MADRDWKDTLKFWERMCIKLERRKTEEQTNKKKKEEAQNEASEEEKCQNEIRKILSFNLLYLNDMKLFTAFFIHIF